MEYLAEKDEVGLASATEALSSAVELQTRVMYKADEAREGSEPRSCAVSRPCARAPGAASSAAAGGALTVWEAHRTVR